MDWNAIRSDYPVLSRSLYADNAAIGAIPKSAADAGSAVIRRLCEQGMAAYMELKGGVESVRSDVADYLGARASDIGFTDSTSTSMNLIAMMATQEWKRGGTRRDQVVLARDEFPSSSLGWIRQGFEPVWVEPEPNGGYSADKLLTAVGPRTRAVVTSQVQYKTGIRMDVEAISRELSAGDVWHVMNATHAAGVIPQSVVTDGYAAVTVSSVKWLCAGVGTGILYLSERLRREARIPVAGWMSQQDPFAMINDELLTTDSASAVETGAVELSRLYVLGECVRIALALRPDSCHRRVLDLNGRLMEGLLDLNAEVVTPTADDQRAGIVSVRKANADEWKAWSMERNVIVSQRGPDVLRFSLHFFNNEEDIERLLETWREGP
jgi:selenocysteine lyase/cysteine desulfurase